MTAGGRGAAQEGARGARHQRLHAADPEPAARRPAEQGAIPVHPAERAAPASSNDWAMRLQDRMRADPLFRDVTSDSQLRGLQATLKIDRDRANTLGVSIDDIRTALYSAFGERQVSTIYTPADSYQVIMEVAPGAKQDESAFTSIYVRSSRPARWCRCRASRRSSARSGRPRSTTSASCRRSRCRSTSRPARRSATPRANIEQYREQIRMPASIITSYGGDAAVFKSSQGSQAILIVVGAAGDLRAARRALRELHPPADDPRRPAVGGGRRAADADAVRPGPDADRDHRHPAADRHRQEERDHDDRLRARRAAHAGHGAGGRRSARPACCASGRS